MKEQYSSDPSTTNPKDKKGNHTICRRCRSIYHWIVDCPHNSTEDNSKDSYFTRSPEEEIYIALLQSCAPKSQDEITGLVAETLSKGVIDSGCTKTVAGERSFNDYLQTLSNEEVQNIQYCGSNAQFRFGDSPHVQSKKKALLPMVMGNKNIKLSTDIVPTDVPLLLSKQTMKTAEADIDFKTDTITLFGCKQDLLCTSSGHYAIPITANSFRSKDEINDVLLSTPHSDVHTEINDILLSIDHSDVDSVAKKLHQQFSHPVED